jgi:hypothetical protein
MIYIKKRRPKLTTPKIVDTRVLYALLFAGVEADAVALAPLALALALVLVVVVLPVSPLCSPPWTCGGSEELETFAAADLKSSSV